MAPHISAAGYRALLQFEPPSRRPGMMRPGLDTSTDDDFEQLMLNVGGGLVGGLVAVVLMGVLIAACAYCCIVKYKMCTPIPDPTQEERRPNRRQNRRNHNTVNNVNQVDNGIIDQEQQATTEEEQSVVAPIVKWTYDNSELIIRPPPGYIEGRFYPFTPIPLPSYDTIYSSSTSLSGLEYTHHAISTYATPMRDSGILTNEPGSAPQTPEPAAQHTNNPAVPNDRTSTVDAADVIANPSVTDVNRGEQPLSETESSIEGEEPGELPVLPEQQSNGDNITTDNNNNDPSAVPVDLSVVIANSNVNTDHVQPAGEVRDHEELPSRLSQGSFRVYFGENFSSSESEEDN